MSIMIQRADLLIVNRFPGCEATTERALTIMLRDANSHATLLSGSTQDLLFIDTIEAAAIDLLPTIARP